MNIQVRACKAVCGRVRVDASWEAGVKILNSARAKWLKPCNLGHLFDSSVDVKTNIVFAPKFLAVVLC